MSADFLSLFRRSRFSTQLGGPNVSREDWKRGMEQRERFAGAMIAFGLRHHHDFRRHFLQEICAWEIPPKKESDISVEEHPWGDLVVKCTPHLLVVELKIGASLQKHQNPARPSWFLKPGGYGREIRDFASSHGFALPRYMVLHQNRVRPASHKRVGGIPCLHKEWLALVRSNGEREKGLEKDIYDCLAAFGIRCFYGRGYDMKKLGRDAVKSSNLLLAVLAAEGGNMDRAKWDIYKEWIGLKITSTDFPSLKPFSGNLGTVRAPLGWFGYEGEALSFWIYKATPRAKQVLERLVKSGRVGGKLEPATQDGDLKLWCSADESPGDKEWFMAIFHALKAHTKM